MVTTNEEQQAQSAEERTIGERMAAVEAQQELLIEVVRENGRRSDENYRALDTKIDSKIDALDTKFDENYRALDAKIDTKIDALDTKFDAKLDALDAKFDAKIDRLTYFLLGIGGAVVIAIVVQIVLQLVL